MHDRTSRVWSVEGFELLKVVTGTRSHSRVDSSPALCAPSGHLPFHLLPCAWCREERWVRVDVPLKDGAGAAAPTVASCIYFPPGMSPVHATAAVARDHREGPSGGGKAAEAGGSSGEGRSSLDGRPPSEGGQQPRPSGEGRRPPATARLFVVFEEGPVLRFKVVMPASAALSRSPSALTV